MNNIAVTAGPSNPADLIRTIFASDNPEKVAQSSSPLDLYLSIQAHGLESSLELLPILRSTQYKSLLDLHLWQGDLFAENNFWQWLALVEQDKDLEQLELFFAAIDLRLLAVIICRHVKVFYNEEPTDQPPTIDSYTPDKGFTWLQFLSEDTEKKRLLGRLLAFISEKDSAIFYQLLAESGYISPIEYEEESYKDKTGRLLDLGVPSSEESAKLHSPIFADSLPLEPSPPTITKINGNLLPLVLQSSLPQPLADLLQELSRQNTSVYEAATMELAKILNAALVHYWVELHENDRISQLAGFIGGCLNIGLEVSSTKWNMAPIEAYHRLNLQLLYRLGLGQIRTLITLANKKYSERKSSQYDTKLDALIDGLNARPPLVPSLVFDSKEIQAVNYRPLINLAQVKLIQDFLTTV